MVIGLILAGWMIAHARGRSELSSITQSMERVGWSDPQPIEKVK